MNPLHIYFVLDRSGSMESIRADVIGGFNTFVHEQQALPDPCRLTLIQFDNQDVHEVTIKNEDIVNVKDLGVTDFVPRGGTPLYDAIGQAITEAQMRLEAQTEIGKPEDIIMVIFTDGGENSSRQYTQQKAFDLITKKESEGWTFVYMGANQDSYATASLIGAGAGSTSNFLASAHGTSTAYKSLSDNMTSYRGTRAATGAAPEDFFETKEAEDVK